MSDGGVPRRRRFAPAGAFLGAFALSACGSDAADSPGPGPATQSGAPGIDIEANRPFSPDPLLSAPACGTAVLCDGFDTAVAGEAPGAPWRVDASGAAVAVGTEHAFSGTQSLHVSAAAGAYKRGFISVALADVFPGPVHATYGRMMVWLQAAPSGDVHWTFVEAQGQTADGFLAKYRYGGQKSGRLMANYDTEGRATDCWTHSQVPMPTARWACIEWHFDSPGELLELWVDGDHINDIEVAGQGQGCLGHDLADRWQAPAPFETLRLGWERYQQSDAQDIWLDDVRLDSHRIGCPSAVQP